MNYLTVKSEHSAETEEKSSRFIATLVPYSQFEEKLTALRSVHRKANHHVTAVRYFDENDRIIEFCKDDGEPSGTSGMPVLKTIIGANLVDVAVIVTRYFGGTKFGTGGLARAYSGASRTVIQETNFVSWEQIIQFDVYAVFSEVSHTEELIMKTKARVIEREFDQTGVRFFLSASKETASMFMT